MLVRSAVVIFRASALAMLIMIGMTTSADAQGARVNKIVALLEAGKPVFGIFSGPKTPESAMEIAKTEADFVFYSMERGPFDVPGMQVYMQFMMDRARLAESGFNEQPILTRIPPIRDGRVEAQDRTKRLLDAGVYGVVFPHVETAEDAAWAVRSMRYRPQGARPSDSGVAARCIRPTNISAAASGSRVLAKADLRVLAASSRRRRSDDLARISTSSAASRPSTMDANAFNAARLISKSAFSE